MQVVDGKHWGFGPMVYDEGLHVPSNPKFKEPGYLKGMEAGGRLITQTLSQPITVPFYKLLHKTCWSNHEGEGSFMRLPIYSMESMLGRMNLLKCILRMKMK
jgi:hypothetical protein